MSTLSGAQQERARKNQSVILSGLLRHGQVHVAAAVGVHETTVSTFKSEQVERFAKMLAAMDLKIVPTEMKCYRPDDIEPLLKLAQQHLRRVTSVHDFA